MLFNSYIFIFAFLPLCLLGYYILKNRFATAAKVLLVAFSLWFYGYFNLRYLAIMVGSVLVNYLIYQGLIKLNQKKLLLTTGVIANLGVLFYFKYFDFFISNVNLIFKTDIGLRHILLPLGISFFTFQQISFLKDVYQGTVTGVSFVDYALFVTFFPQLIAGPIVEAQEMLPQFEAVGDKKVGSDEVAAGIMIFVMGLAKKVLIADTFGVAVDYIYGSLAGGNSTESLLVILFYTLQLYFDFSGYCDMAIGIGKMLGIDIALNFNSPYKATNIYEFWKRWHITLNRFFTGNIYIPLGGNRRGRFRMYLNLFIVFFLSGLWHGAGYNYILWGCMHGLLYIITRAVTANRNSGWNIPRPIAVLCNFIFVNVAWVFFRASDIGEALQVFSNVFKGSFMAVSEPVLEAFELPELWYVLKVLHLTEFGFSQYICMAGFVLVTLFITFFMPNVHEIARKSKYYTGQALLTAVLFVWCVVSLSGVSTFLYFNF